MNELYPYSEKNNYYPFTKSLGLNEPLVTSRNNFDAYPNAGVFRVPRPYVQACAKATLGLAYSNGQIIFKPLMCGSWSCPNCRKVLAARTLDRLNRGMLSRASYARTFITLTVSPEQFKGFRIGTAFWDASN